MRDYLLNRLPVPHLTPLKRTVLALSFYHHSQFDVQKEILLGILLVLIMYTEWIIFAWLRIVVEVALVCE